MDIPAWLLLLITILCGECYGESSDNCTAPTFEGGQFVHDYYCYRYNLGILYVGKPVVMEIKLAENNLTFNWWRDHHESVDCKPGTAGCQYQLTNNNMTLNWTSAVEGTTVFYVNATNNCGGSSIGCFVIDPYCQQCHNCPITSNVTHVNKTVPQYSDLTLNTSVQADHTSVALQWCFVAADKQNSCCICDNDAGVDPRRCSHSDWSLTTYHGDTCSYRYGCLLSVSNISMNYSGGVFISTVLFALQNTSFLYTHIDVTQNNTASHDHQSAVLYYVIGGGAIVGVFVIVALGTIVCIRRYQKTHGSYEELPSLSSSPGTTHRSKPQQINEDRTTLKDGWESTAI